jgi:hypothetical protein
MAFLQKNNADLLRTINSPPRFSMSTVYGPMKEGKHDENQLPSNLPSYFIPVPFSYPPFITPSYKIFLTNLPCNRNAAVFFWLDLRPYLLPTSHPIPPESQPLAILKTSPLSSHDLALYRAKEAQIVSTCMKNGVFIGYGSNFFTEELGWFRVTFTARKEALVEGLKRILSSLEEVEAA